MEIKILGGGCANCRALEAMARQALSDLGIEATVEEVSDYAAIAAYGVMRTPALVIDEVVFVSGRVPGQDEVRRIIQGIAG